MTPQPSPFAPQPLACDDACHTPVSPRVNERLCHLFRTSLKDGRIHPLYLPILEYRHAGAAR